MAHDTIMNLTQGSDTAGLRIPHEALQELHEDATASELRDVLALYIKNGLRYRAQMKLQAHLQAELDQIAQVIEHGLGQISNIE